jgi:hypothetical protein
MNESPKDRLESLKDPQTTLSTTEFGEFVDALAQEEAAEKEERKAKRAKRATVFTPIQKAKKTLHEANLTENDAARLRVKENKIKKAEKETAAQSGLLVEGGSTNTNNVSSEVPLESVETDKSSQEDTEESNIEGTEPVEHLTYDSVEDEAKVSDEVISVPGPTVPKTPLTTEIVPREEIRESVEKTTGKTIVSKLKESAWGANEFLRENMVRSTDTFKELFSVLKGFKTINCAGVSIDALDIISEIEAIRKLSENLQSEALENKSLGVLGIREKVIELLEKESEAKVAAKPIAIEATPAPEVKAPDEVVPAAVGGIAERKPTKDAEAAEVAPIVPVLKKSTPPPFPSGTSEGTKIKANTEVRDSTVNGIDMGDFSIDDALNAKGTIEFLSQYPGASSHMDDPLWVYTRIEARKKRDLILADITGTIGKTVEAEIGIKIEAGDLKDVSEAINAKLLENPEELFKMARILETSKTVTEGVSALEQSIEQFAGSNTFDELKRERGVLALAHKRSGFNIIGRMWEKMKWGALNLGTESVPTDASLLASQNKNTPSHLLHAAYREAREKYNISNKTDIESRIAGLNAHVNVVEKNQALQTNLSELRERIIEDIIGESTFASLVAKKVEQKVGGMTTSTKSPSVKDIGNIDSAIAYLKTLKANKSFEYTDYVDVESLEERLKGQALSVASSVLERAVANIKMGSKVLEAFEKSIVDIAVRKSIGSHEGKKHVQAFVVETLETIVGKFPDTVDGHAKKIVVQRAIVKLNSLNS